MILIQINKHLVAQFLDDTLAAFIETINIKFLYYQEK